MSEHCDALRDLVPFVHFKKHEKNLSTLLKVTLFNGCFHSFFSNTNGTKSCKASHICLSVKGTLMQIRKSCNTFAFIQN